MTTTNTEGLKPSTMVRIEARVDRITETGCWIWLGATNNRGYGKLSVAGKLVLAHRASFEAATGNIDPELMVCHTCDVKPCVNPRHLYQGTGRQNMDDAIARGQSPRGERNGNSILKEPVVADIKYLLALGIPVTVISNKHGVPRWHVREIRDNKLWTRVKAKEIKND